MAKPTTKPTTKPAAKPASNKPASKPNNNVIVAWQTPEAAIGQTEKDAFGARLNTGRSTVNHALAAADAAGGWSLRQIVLDASSRAVKLGIPPRGAVSSHLTALRDAGLIESGPRGWIFTKLGRSIWSRAKNAPAMPKLK